VAVAVTGRLRLADTVVSTAPHGALNLLATAALAAGLTIDRDQLSGPLLVVKAPAACRKWPPGAATLCGLGAGQVTVWPVEQLRWNLGNLYICRGCLAAAPRSAASGPSWSAGPTAIGHQDPLGAGKVAGERSGGTLPSARRAADGSHQAEWTRDRARRCH
jgi:hypothetical protein